MGYLTEAQCDLLRLQYQRGMSKSDIAAAVNALPGGTVSPRSVPVLANRMNVRRKNVFKLNSDADFLPIVADFADVTDWAWDNNVRFTDWDHLPAVNEARFKAGLPEFARMFDNPRCQPRRHGTSGE